MKTWDEFLVEMGQDGTWMGRPLADLDRYITGITNRIILMQPEEIESWRHKLTELRNMIDQKLR